MNIKKLIDQIGGRERLDALIDDEDCRVTVVEQELLAQIALAVLDAQQNPFMFAISDCDGKAHFDECCVSAHGCDLEDVVGSLNEFRDDVDDGYSIVPVYTTQPAASMPNLKQVGYLWVSEHGGVVYSPSNRPIKGLHCAGPIFGDISDNYLLAAAPTPENKK